MTAWSRDLNSMVRCVGNFSCENSNGTLFVIDMRSSGHHQFVSDSHVDNVRWCQLELQCIHVDVTQHKSHKLVLGIVAILHSCRQHADSCTAGTGMLTSIKPAKQLLDCNHFNDKLN